MFDQSSQRSLKGTVKEFQWTNPHAFIEIDVPGKHGDAQRWSVELNSPNNLKRQGWKATTLHGGDSVMVVINPLRDGSFGGLFVSIALADGTVLSDPTRVRGGAINVPAAPAGKSKQ